MIEYKILDNRYFKGATEVLTQSFSREPMVKHLDIPYREVFPSAQVACLVACNSEQQRDLSTIAIENGRVIGCLVSYDYSAIPLFPFHAVPRKFDPIFELLLKLNKGMVFGEQTLYQFMLGVDLDHEGQGVGKAIVNANNEQGRRKGYEVAKAEVTGRASQRIFSDLGYNIVAEIPYAQFLFRGISGRNVFRNIKGEYSCQLVTKALHVSR